MVGNPEDRFSHNEAQMMLLYVTLCELLKLIMIISPLIAAKGYYRKDLKMLLVVNIGHLQSPHRALGHA